MRCSERFSGSGFQTEPSSKSQSRSEFLLVVTSGRQAVGDGIQCPSEILRETGPQKRAQGRCENQGHKNDLQGSALAMGDRARRGDRMIRRKKYVSWTNRKLTRLRECFQSMSN